MGEFNSALAERQPDAGMVIGLMADGFAAEKNPTPIATIMADGVATEAILQRLFDQDEERFTTYAFIGEPEEVYGGIQVIDGDAKTANAFIRKLIGAVQRPSDEEEPTDRAAQSDDQETSSTGMLLALRRSKVGRTVAVAAVTAAGFFGKPAEAEANPILPDASSQQECIDDALVPMQIADARLKRPHKNDPATQVALAQATTERMPSNCLSQFYVERGVRFEFDVQDAMRRRWWNPFLANTLDIDPGSIYDSGSASQVLRLPIPFNDSPPTKSELGFGIYYCSPGPEKTGVKLLTEEDAIDIQTNAILGQKKFPVVPVKKILPKGC